MDAPTVLKQVVDSSASLTSWALACAGATVVAIVSTSYRRPPELWHRLIYLAFLPGWFFLARSLAHGDGLVRHYLASLMVKTELVAPIAQEMNDAFMNQHVNLMYSLACFGAWLIAYLGIWIFAAEPLDRKNT